MARLPQSFLSGTLLSVSVPNIVPNSRENYQNTIKLIQKSTLVASKPHTRPCRAELNILIEGSMTTQSIQENGARPVTNTLIPMQMTIFPLGSMHTEFNPDCSPAKFVASFANEDTGVQREAQNFFALDTAVVQAAVGNDFAFEGKDVTRFRDLIPLIIAHGVEAFFEEVQHCTGSVQPPS